MKSRPWTAALDLVPAYRHYDGVTGRWPVDVEALSPCSVGTVVWRHAGRTTMTVVIKATLSLDEGTATPTRPDDLVLEERLSGAGSPTQDADIAPYKPRAEVTFVGHATSSTPVQHLSTRLSVHAGNSSIDKPLSDVGERPTPPAPPVPFTRMALTWDRALAETNENPIGANQQSGRFPNVYDPQDPRAPASYAPMSRTWGARRRFIGRSDPERASGLTPEMPPDLSWGFFLGAPQDQQLNRLSGSEIIVLENLLEGRPRVRSQLPGVRGVARVYGPGTPAGGGNIELRLDTLAIDGDRGVVSVVWRGTMPVTDDATTRGYRILAGVEMNGQPPISFPAQPAPRAPDAQPQKDSSTMPVGIQMFAPPAGDAKPAYDLDDEPSSTAGGSTMAIDPEVAMKMLAGRGAALPFPGGSPPAPPPPAPPPPAPPPPAPPPPAPPPPTAIPAAPAPPAGPAFPSPQNVVVRPSATFVADDDDSVGSTMAITPEAAAALIARQSGGLSPLGGMPPPLAAPPAPPPPVQLPPGFGPPPPVPLAPAPPALAHGVGRAVAPHAPPAPPPPPMPPPPPDDDDGGGGTMVIHSPEPPRRR